MTNRKGNLQRRKCLPVGSSLNTSVTQTHTNTHTHTLSLSPSLTHTHTHKHPPPAPHTHRHTQRHTHTYNTHVWCVRVLACVWRRDMFVYACATKKRKNTHTHT